MCVCKHKNDHHAAPSPPTSRQVFLGAFSHLNVWISIVKQIRAVV